MRGKVLYMPFFRINQNNFLEEILTFASKSFKYNFDRLLLKFRRFYYFDRNIKHSQFESFYRKVLTTHIYIKK